MNYNTWKKNTLKELKALKLIYFKEKEITFIRTQSKWYEVELSFCLPNQSFRKLFSYAIRKGLCISFEKGKISLLAFNSGEENITIKRYNEIKSFSWEN